jgi:hypothetical protein
MPQYPDGGTFPKTRADLKMLNKELLGLISVSLLERAEYRSMMVDEIAIDSGYVLNLPSPLHVRLFK